MEAKDIALSHMCKDSFWMTGCMDIAHQIIYLFCNSIIATVKEKVIFINGVCTADVSFGVFTSL